MAEINMYENRANVLIVSFKKSGNYTRASSPTVQIKKSQVFGLLIAYRSPVPGH